MLPFQQIIWLLLVIPSFVCAQKKNIFDTVQPAYKQQLLSFYESSVASQKLNFSHQISDKKTKNDLEATYTDVTNDFKENINKGIFLDNEIYRNTVQQLIKNVQENNPKQKQLKHTTILFSFGINPNAYAIGNDIIVLYIPLLQKLENEMQLAFIICHEIAHNLLQHSYNSIIEYATLKNSEQLIKQTRALEKTKYNKGQIASGLYKDIIYGKSKNNRKLEHQADSLGFILFKNSFPEYSYEAIKTLKILEQIDEERDSLSINDYKILFDTEKSPFKESWLTNKEFSEYNYDNETKFWTIDSLKTHPDCAVRIDYLNKHFKLNKEQGFQTSKNYNELKNSAVYNTILGLYFIEEYGRSLYQSLLLYKENSDDEFLKHMIHSNLIKLQNAQNTYTLNKHLDTNNPKYSNSYNTFLYFFRQLRKSQLNAIINKHES